LLGTGLTRPAVLAAVSGRSAATPVSDILMTAGLIASAIQAALACCTRSAVLFETAKPGQVSGFVNGIADESEPKSL